MFDFGIIGGGASGMYASILLAKKGYKVAVIEANDRIGKKLLATGNGKCNLSNVDISTDYYNTNEIRSIVTDFDMQKQMKELGLVTKVISGRIYPFSEKANNVLNVLLSNMQKYGVKIFTDCLVTDLKINDNVNVITNKNNFECKKVCLATGSKATFGIDSLSLYEKLGHKRIKNTPSLVPLLAKKLEQIKGIDGVRQEANVSLYDGGKLISTEFGEVQFRKDGISGIVIMNMSSKMSNNNMLEGICYLDFMPQFTKEEVETLLKNQITAEFGLLNKNLMQRIMGYGVDSIKHYRIDVVKSEDYKQAQVVHGGLDLSQFNLKDMSSKVNGKLYAIGEVLNVDGVCGGYNLHFAFASAYNFTKEF